MIKQVEVQSRQSIADIAIQEYGSISALPMLIEDNAAVLTDITNIPVGTMLSIRTPLPAVMVVNKQVVAHFSNYIKPATWIE